MNLLARLIAVLFFGVCISVPSPIQADELVEKCVRRALENILEAKGVPKFVDIGNVTMNIVGRQWGTLTKDEQAMFKTVVEKVMTARIVAKGKAYRGIQVSDIVVTPSKYDGKVEISGLIGQYSFDTIAVITEKRCQFYTLSIEGIFRLHAWLADQPEIRTVMDDLKLKY